MNVGGVHENGIGYEQIELNDPQLEGHDPGHYGDEGNEKPVERLAARVAHPAHDDTTLRHRRAIMRNKPWPHIVFQIKSSYGILKKNCSHFNKRRKSGALQWCSD